MTDDRLYSNGIAADTGDYLQPPLGVAEAARALAEGPPPAEGAAAKPLFGIDPEQLDEAGWGVVFPAAWEGTPRLAAVREALEPLLRLRRQQAGDGLYRELSYREGEDKVAFLERHGAGFGAAEPRTMPYYLLLVGDATEIPFEVQYRLDVEYAVGRLALNEAADYASYARTVTAAERRELVRPPRAALFAVDTGDDPVTRAMAEHLVEPLAEALAPMARNGWHLQRVDGTDAVKRRLRPLLGAEAPALLFTTSHGVGFRADDPRQRDGQGALLCADWPGRGARRPLAEEHYFAASDLAPEEGPAGAVAFLLACHSAGTPAASPFAFRSDFTAAAQAAEPFVARLGERLLAHPRGGALAVIGHVAQAWLYSFLGLHAGRHPQTFVSVVRALVEGRCRVGWAMDAFGRRYGDLAAELAERLGRARLGEEVDERELVRLWTAANDARSYVVLGDPAVRLSVANGGGGS